jgi:aspartate racemase
MTTKTVLTAGVLGGMGPAATLDFFAKVLATTPAASDQDHIPLIIDNNTQVPNRNDAVAGLGPSPAPALAQMARRLEAAGADFLVMVCNAAHAFQPEIQSATRLPFVSLVEETAQAVRREHPTIRRVGVMASSGCLEARLYERAFANPGIEVLAPEGPFRDWFMEILYRVKGGEFGSDIRAEMKAVAENLLQRGAEAIVAGCTEVPLVLGAADLDKPLINSTDVLVERTLAYARREAALPERR